MNRCPLFVVAVSIAVLLSHLAGAAAEAELFYTVAEVEPKLITILPSSEVELGDKVTVVCSWAQAKGKWISVPHSISYLKQHNWQIPAEISLDGVLIKEFSVPARIVGALDVKSCAFAPAEEPGGTLTSGSESAEWVASKTGVHSGKFVIDPYRRVYKWMDGPVQDLAFSLKVTEFVTLDQQKGGKKLVAIQPSVKIQPVLTGVTPQLLALGKGYTLTFQGKGLTQ